MALVQCPGCGRVLSDLASACIQCGRPVSNTAGLHRPRTTSIPKKRTATFLKTILTILGVILFFVVISISGWFGREASTKLTKRTRKDQAKRSVSQIADGLAKELPMQINADLVLGGVVGNEETLNYYFVMPNYVDGSIGPEQATLAKAVTKNAAVTTMCTGQMAQYLKMGVVVVYHYYDKNGTYLKNVTVVITNADCIAAGLAD